MRGIVLYSIHPEKAQQHDKKGKPSKNIQGKNGLSPSYLPLNMFTTIIRLNYIM